MLHLFTSREETAVHMCIFDSIRPMLIPCADDHVSSNVDGFNSNTPPARRRPARTDEATMDVIKSMINQLSAGDWRVRYDAINTFLEMCLEQPDSVSMHIIKVRRSYTRPQGLTFT